MRSGIETVARMKKTLKQWRHPIYAKTGFQKKKARLSLG